MKSTLHIIDNNLIFIHRRNRIKIPLSKDTFYDKRTNDIVFYGAIEMASYDHRNDVISDVRSIPKIVIPNRFLTKELKQSIYEKASIKQLHKSKDLLVVFLPVIILIVLFVLLNIISKL